MTQAENTPEPAHAPTTAGKSSKAEQILQGLVNDVVAGINERLAQIERANMDVTRAIDAATGTAVPALQRAAQATAGPDAAHMLGIRFSSAGYTDR